GGVAVNESCALLFFGFGSRVPADETAALALWTPALRMRATILAFAGRRERSHVTVDTARVVLHDPASAATERTSGVSVTVNFTPVARSGPRSFTRAVYVTVSPT